MGDPSLSVTDDSFRAIYSRDRSRKSGCGCRKRDAWWGNLENTVEHDPFNEAKAAALSAILFTPEERLFWTRAMNRRIQRASNVRISGDRSGIDPRWWIDEQMVQDKEQLKDYHELLRLQMARKQLYNELSVVNDEDGLTDGDLDEYASEMFGQCYR
ncbi:hypothetical protein CSKR_201242 [Clonorchis sinensis]|uniref:Uncharacterized protein n=1 Tax=Clonorchis sinensis TaxID=79923 RepID=A0A8T1MMK6_CLOSI|nr:hypothetical protein CSKR_201242 [Clonorchis sinensis]